MWEPLRPTHPTKIMWPSFKKHQLTRTKRTGQGQEWTRGIHKFGKLEGKQGLRGGLTAHVKELTYKLLWEMGGGGPKADGKDERTEAPELQEELGLEGVWNRPVWPCVHCRPLSPGVPPHRAAQDRAFASRLPPPTKTGG